MPPNNQSARIISIMFSGFGRLQGFAGGECGGFTYRFACTCGPPNITEGIMRHCSLLRIRFGDKG